MIKRLGKKGPLSLSKRKNAAPPTETTLMLEALLDGKKSSKKKQKKTSQRASATVNEGIKEATLPSKRTETPALERVFASGSLSDAKTFKMNKSLPPRRRKSDLRVAKENNVNMVSRIVAPETKTSTSGLQSLLTRGGTTTQCRHLEYEKQTQPKAYAKQILRPTPPPKELKVEGRHAEVTNITSPKDLQSSKPAAEQPPGISAPTLLSLNVSRVSKKRSITAAAACKPMKRQLLVYDLPESSTCFGERTNDSSAAPPKRVEDIDASFVSSDSLKQAGRTLDSTSTFQKGMATADYTQHRVKKPVAKKREPSVGNFVRLNMKNNAGSCRGAKKKSKWAEKRKEWKQSKDKGKRGTIPRPPTFDPVNDFLDGSYSANSKSKDTKESAVPYCGGHQRPCKLLIVKKAGVNKGRKFHVCSMPRGEQCDFFEWADNSAAAAKEALLKKSSKSGFVARQVSSYVERFRVFTVPELKKEAQKRGLNPNGKKQELLMRISLFVRDELAGVVNDEDSIVEDIPTICDDSSVSSAELEVCGDDDVEVNISPEPNQEGQRTEDSRPDSEGRLVSDDGKVRTSTAQDCLSNIFGLARFREGQEWSIGRSMAGKRSLLVAPTGFGKSLCYALPAALMDGTTIVISPLISLIEDQLRQLPPRIPAATLSGGMSASALACTIDDVLKGRIKILYVSPERLTTPSFRRLFKLRWNNEKQVRERPFPQVSLLCIDEAHCISQWAHNFRPSYLRIRSLLELVEPQSLLAVTATAGPPIVRDICHYLAIPDQHQKETGVKILKSDRDNIDIFCKVMENVESRMVLLQKLLSKPPKKANLIDSEIAMREGCLSDCNVIVYVWRQRDVEVVAEALSAEGVEGGVVGYHGGMDSKARSRAQSRFLRGKARICVATVAFGMGVNKTDIDAVVHLNLPSSLEHYLQEIGRAGRDGRPAKAVSLPIQEEVVVRHSLAHSNLISPSQVQMLLLLVESLVEQARIDLSLRDLEANQLRVFIGVPLSQTVAALDCKVETIETLLSLLEGDEVCQTFSRFEGRVNETATITLRRTSLEQLGSREQVVRCISKCSKQLKETTGDETENLSKTAREMAKRGYGCGTYQFSVSRCTNLMGPTAEPRHVFAALRRLQSQGELELVFDTDGYALQLEVDANGLGNAEEIGSLARTLWNHFTNQIINTALKVKVIDRILRNVASTKDDKDSKSEKSSRLVKFQELAAEELSKSGEATVEQQTRATEKGVSLKELVYDAQSVVHQVRDAINQSTVDSPFAVRFDHSDFMDYTALTVTKFLHGLDTTRTSMFSKHHPLFGKWRHYDFEAARLKVQDSLVGIR